MPLKLRFFKFKFFLFLTIFAGTVFGQDFENTSRKVSGTYRECANISSPDTVYIASDNVHYIYSFSSQGKIIKYDLSGNVIWTLDVGGTISQKPLIKKDVIYILTESGGDIFKTDNSNNIPAEEIKDGIKKVKEKEEKEESERNRTKTENKAEPSLYFMTAVDVKSGISIWKKELRSSFPPSIFFDADDLYIYFGSSERSDIFYVNPSDGAFLERAALKLGLSRIIAGGDGKILLKTSTEDLILVNLNGGLNGGDVRNLSNSALKKIENGIFAGNLIILSDASGSILRIDSERVIPKSNMRFGGRVTSLSAVGDKIFITSNDNFVYSLTSDLQKIVWKKRVGGRIPVTPFISETTALIAPQGENALLFLRLGDGEIVNRVFVPKGEEIISTPVLLRDRLIIHTGSGIRFYTNEKCEEKEEKEERVSKF